MARGDFLWDFGPSRLRSALVIVQITASVMLLITAAVLVRAAQRFGSVDPGLRTHDVISLDIRESARGRVVAALRNSPVVAQIGAASTIPLDGNAPAVAVSTTDRNDLIRTRYRYVSPEYFELFDVPIISGRGFTPEEAESRAAVTVVSESLARRVWPDRPAVGESLRVLPDARLSTTASIRRHAVVQVIGVSRDTAADVGDSGPVTSAIHLPIHVSTGGGLLVRVTSEPEAARRSIEAALDVAAPGAVQEIHKLQEFVAGRLYPFRAAYWVSGAVGTLALLLTLSGVYGVLSYLVNQRAKEISIRMALGASIGTVLLLVVRQALWLASIGVMAGTFLAIGAARLFSTKVMMVDVFDGPAYITGMVVVIGACLAASWFPALRAARIDPMSTLRAD